MQKRGKNRTYPQISKTWEPKCTQTFKCLLPIACISEDNCISPLYLFSNFISVLGTTGSNNNVIDTSIKIGLLLIPIEFLQTLHFFQKFPYAVWILKSEFMFTISDFIIRTILMYNQQPSDSITYQQF